MPIPVQCSHCEAILKLKDDAKGSLGKKMRCPKCDEVFVTKRYRAPEPEDIVEDYEYDDVEEYDERPRRSSSSRRESGSRSRGGKSKNAVAVPNSTMKIVMSVLSGAVVLIGIGLKVWLRHRGNNAAAPIPAVQPIANNPGLPPGAGQGANPAAASLRVSGEAITDAEYESFGKALEAKIKQEKGRGLVGSLNSNKLVSRSVQGLDLQPTFVLGFSAGAAGAFNQSFAKQLDASLAENGHYRFLRLHGDGAQKRLLFRMSGDGGTNYHDLEIERSATGQFEIVDMHISLSGEKLSETMRRMVVLTAVSQKGSFLKSLTGQLSDFEKSIKQINQFNALKAGGQFAQALAVFKQLPPSIQSEKTFALGRLMVAMQVSEQEYLTAMTDFRNAFPTDACIDFMSIDYHILRKEFDQGLAAVDRFEKNLGGDPYLNMIRANLYSEQKKWDEAKKAIAIVIAAEPTLSNPVFVQAGIGLTQPDNKLVLDSLRILKNQHKLDLGGVATAPEYAGFVKSPEYQEWLKSM